MVHNLEQLKRLHTGRNRHEGEVSYNQSQLIQRREGKDKNWNNDVGRFTRIFIMIQLSPSLCHTDPIHASLQTGLLRGQNVTQKILRINIKIKICDRNSQVQYIERQKRKCAEKGGRGRSLNCPRGSTRDKTYIQARGGQKDGLSFHVMTVCWLLLHKRFLCHFVHKMTPNQDRISGHSIWHRQCDLQRTSKKLKERHELLQKKRFGFNRTVKRL